jgi:hypothetical protein
MIDPVLIYRRTFFAAIAGYIIGNRIGYRQALFSFSFAGLYLLYQFYVDYQIMKSGKYSELYVEMGREGLTGFDYIESVPI